MIAVIVDHYAIAGRESAGLGVVLANGRAMRVIDGFEARHTFTARDDARRVTTVTLWRNDESYQSWLQSDERKAVVRPAGELWVSQPKTTIFDKVQEL